MYKPVSGKPNNEPVIAVGVTQLKSVIHFCSLRSTFSNDANVDKKVTNRIKEVYTSSERLIDRVWIQREIEFHTKIHVHKVVILSELLNGCKT